MCPGTSEAVRHHGGMSSRPAQRSVKISADERGGWSSDRPRRDGAPPRPANLFVHCRVLRPTDQLRYSPGSLLVVVCASPQDSEGFLERVVEDRAALLTPGKVRQVLAGRVAEQEMDARAHELLFAAAAKRLRSQVCVVPATATLDAEEREPLVRLAAELGRPRHLILLETARERVRDEDAAALNELRRAPDPRGAGAAGVSAPVRPRGRGPAEVRRIVFRAAPRED